MSSFISSKTQKACGHRLKWQTRKTADNLTHRGWFCAHCDTAFWTEDFLDARLQAEREERVKDRQYWLDQIRQLRAALAAHEES